MGIFYEDKNLYYIIYWIFVKELLNRNYRIIIKMLIINIGKIFWVNYLNFVYKYYG